MGKEFDIICKKCGNHKITIDHQSGSYYGCEYCGEDCYFIIHCKSCGNEKVFN